MKVQSVLAATAALSLSLFVTPGACTPSSADSIVVERDATLAAGWSRHHQNLVARSGIHKRGARHSGHCGASHSHGRKKKAKQAVASSAAPVVAAAQAPAATSSDAPATTAAPVASSEAAPAAAAQSTASASDNTQLTATSSGSCFPAVAQDIPSSTATKSSLKSWWCAESSEYAFMGFSYDATPCQSASQLAADFSRMRSEFGSRYVRMYGNCDRQSYNDDLVEAAASAGLGVYALIWFGFEGGSEWQSRRDRLVNTINSNKKAPWVIRSITFGSEPLFDHVLDVGTLASEITKLKNSVSAYGIGVTISEMPYGMQINGDAPGIFSVIDTVQANILPFFDSGATSGGNTWAFVSWALGYFREHGNGKVIRMTQTGWPSNDSVWKANSGSAVASVASEKAYFDTLDAHCSDLKALGVGWFAHIWSDSMLGGWGVLDGSGNPKFNFKPKATC